MNFRMASNTLFGLAIGCAALLKAFAVPESLVWLAVGSVAGAMILTNLMWIRSVGLAGVGGLSLVYSRLAGQSMVGTALTIMAACLMVVAVLLMIFADLSYQLKRKNLDEV